MSVRWPYFGEFPENLVGQVAIFCYRLFCLLTGQIALETCPLEDTLHQILGLLARFARLQPSALYVFASTAV